MASTISIHLALPSPLERFDYLRLYEVYFEFIDFRLSENQKNRVL